MKDSANEHENLGLELRAGDTHYRAYVGFPEEYDLIAAMTFNLLTTLGLRQNHKLLDIGCGSLRVGRLLIPYLNVGNYVGIEPNRWLVEEGINREVGRDLMGIKKPQIYFSDSPKALRTSNLVFDYAVAQSIFSHSGLDLIKSWLEGISPLLSSTGALAATFLTSQDDFKGNGWIYPACVNYTEETMKRVASAAGLTLQLLDWKHPRQTWGLFAKPEFDLSWIKGKTLTWNARMIHRETALSK